MNEIAKEQLTSELLELGEMLFDTAIAAADAAVDATVQPPTTEEALLVDEMRVAADEFFTALRLLLA
jgi:hypothetical protein